MLLFFQRQDYMPSRKKKSNIKQFYSHFLITFPDSKFHYCTQNSISLRSRLQLADMILHNELWIHS